MYLEGGVGENRAEWEGNGEGGGRGSFSGLVDALTEKTEPEKQNEERNHIHTRRLRLSSLPGLTGMVHHSCSCTVVAYMESIPVDVCTTRLYLLPLPFRLSVPASRPATLQRLLPSPD